jgi:hypothetical protein
MPQTTLYLHLGLHKTATTFLQRKLFPSLDGLKVLVRPRFNILKEHEYDGWSSLTKFLNSSPLIWRELGDDFFQRADQLSKRSSRENLLISDEFGFWQNTNDPCVAARHVKEICRAARDNSFSQVKVLICIRKQDTWLASAYAETSKNFQNPSQAHFERWVRSRINPYSKFYSSAGVRLRYCRIFSELSKCLHPPNLKIIPFELLSQNPSNFIHKVVIFLGSDKSQDTPTDNVLNRRSKSKNKWSISRRYVRLRPGRLFSALGLEKVHLPDLFDTQEITLSKEMSGQIMQLYRSGNKLLDDKLNLRLGHYNYY